MSMGHIDLFKDNLYLTEPYELGEPSETAQNTILTSKHKINLDQLTFY